MPLRVLCLLGIVLGLPGLVSAQANTAKDVPVLIEMLRHPAAGFRTKAADGLVAIGAPAVPAVLKEFKSGSLSRAMPAALILVTLEARGADAAPDLKAIIQNPSSPDWQWSLAVLALGKVNPAMRKEILPQLKEALTSPSPLRKYEALYALQNLGPDGSEAIPALTAMLAAKREPLQGLILDQTVIDNRAVAWTAKSAPYDDLLILETLDAVGAREAIVPPLLEMSRNRLPSVRLGAATLLLKRPEGKAAGIATLVGLLDDNHYGIRDTAIKSLGELKAEAGPATSALVVMLSRPESSVRRDAAMALGEIGPAASSALPTLRKLAIMQKLVDPTSGRTYDEAIARIEGKPMPMPGTAAPPAEASPKADAPKSDSTPKAEAAPKAPESATPRKD